jgi:hypothetical protein
MRSDSCIAERYPPEVITAMVAMSARPVHDDGHTDCYYAGLLDAALRAFIAKARGGDEWVSGHDLCVRVGAYVTEAVGV